MSIPRFESSGIQGPYGMDTTGLIMLFHYYDKCILHIFIEGIIVIVRPASIIRKELLRWDSVIT